MKNWIKWVIGNVIILIFFLICFYKNVGGIWTTYNRVFNYRPCNMENITDVYRFDRKGDNLYFLPKPISGSLKDFQETAYVWDEASVVIVPNYTDPVCYKGSGKGEDPNNFYCRNLGYYAKIPATDPEYIKGTREAHSYLMDITLSPQIVNEKLEYNKVGCFGWDKEPQM